MMGWLGKQARSTSVFASGVCGVSRGRAGDWPGLAMWPLVTEAAASVHVTLVSASPG